MPGPVIVAIWGLETNYGTADLGSLPVIRTLATLAHDCRRTDLFQGELLAALQILQRGDLSLRDMIGGNAGEMGQTQFLPSSYLKYGVDYDKDGHVNLRKQPAGCPCLDGQLPKGERLAEGRPLSVKGPPISRSCAVGTKPCCIARPLCFSPSA